jgi:hypothetical protein
MLATRRVIVVAIGAGL